MIKNIISIKNIILWNQNFYEITSSYQCKLFFVLTQIPFQTFKYQYIAMWETMLRVTGRSGLQNLIKEAKLIVSFTQWGKFEPCAAGNPLGFRPQLRLCPEAEEEKRGMMLVTLKHLKSSLVITNTHTHTNYIFKTLWFSNTRE